MYWRVALLVLLTTGVPQAKAEPPDEQALRLLNQHRQIAGLTPVKLDRHAKAADLFLGVSDLGVAIDVWMAGMYHRRPMLDPQLERIGVATRSPGSLRSLPMPRATP